MWCALKKYVPAESLLRASRWNKYLSWYCGRSSTHAVYVSIKLWARKEEENQLNRESAR
jgi:hypothetical protein